MERGGGSMKNRGWVAALFISPWIIGFFATVLYPLLSAVYFSLCDYSVLTPAIFVGTRNYERLFSDDVFWIALGNSLLFAAIYLPLSIGASLFLAMLLNLRIPARGFFRTIYFLPTIVPMVCLSVIWQWMLKGEGGLINALLEPLLHAANALTGLHLEAPNWLSEPGSARAALIFASLWTTGNMVLIFLASLQGVPSHLYESAEIDGATSLQKYLYISLPSISPVILYNVITGLIGCLQTFAVPYVLAGATAGPKRALLFLSTYIFQNSFEYWNMGYACAVAIVLFLIVLFLTMVLLRLSRGRVHASAD
jgi:multiple sugar transport system permease protein